MKRIAIFADGTWNSPDQARSTNVLSLAQGVKPNAKGVEQVAFYDWGIGSEATSSAPGLPETA